MLFMIDQQYSVLFNFLFLLKFIDKYLSLKDLLYLIFLLEELFDLMYKQFLLYCLVNLLKN